MKKPTIKDMASAVERRYGKTTGDSKGKRPSPKPSIKVKPKGNIKKGLTGLNAKATIRF